MDTTPAPVAEALARLGQPRGLAPRRPVLRGAAGALVTVGVLDAHRVPDYRGVWITADSVEFLGPSAPRSGLSETHNLPAPTARLADLLQAAELSFLERLEEIDEHLSALQSRSPTLPLREVGIMQRQVTAIRYQIGRTIALAAELDGGIGERFPELPRALPAIESELERLQDLSSNILQVLRDLVLLRNAEEANRIAEYANQLQRSSNRIASLANTSNIRMLGLAYLALVLGLVSAVVLIPNTGATILGMPSAAWVPGIWVDIILAVLAVIPLAVVFSRGWILRMLRGMSSYEFRIEEGLRDLPEVGPDAVAET